MKKYNEPQIYIVNNQKIAERLNQKYNIAAGNLGIVKAVEYTPYENNRYVNLEYSMIDNLHEYSVVIIDLQNKNEVKYCTEDDKPNGIPFLFEMSYPQRNFIPAPLVLKMMRSELKEQCLKIIFAGEKYKQKYGWVEVTGQDRYSYLNHEEHDIYETIQANAMSKRGKKIVAEKNELAQCIAKYTKEYNVIFDFPTIWNEDLGKSEPDPNFIPLLKNQDGENISYIGYSPDCGFEILLPVCEKKDELIEKLLTSILPGILPKYFPESEDFEWIKGKEFIPKEITELEKEEDVIREEYNSKIKALNEKKAEIEQNYKFLNDLLTETGDKLVEAVCTYFKWLGFADVVSIDGSEEILREDIQIIEGNKLYIIEVKGIGGTSTDAECAQVAKHRRRRERENRDKEIIPIYIVNHHRYTNPLLRQNPPFSDNQIEYAESDERGLLTTWQLYNQYKLIEAEIFTKEETRDSLNEWGLISLIPKRLKSIGIFEEYFKKSKACILKLNNSEIRVGDEIYGQKGGKWTQTKITSIQLDDKNVDSVQDGEIGIATETELEKGVEIFVNKS